MAKEHKGVIYILTNPSFKEYVKIGYAHDIEKRLRQLNRSETIPFAFRVYAIYEVKSELTDMELHKLIDNLNPDLRTIETFDGKKRVKEFYAMSAEEAYSILESIAKISGTTECLKRLTPEGHEVIDEEIAKEVQENAKRGPFRFSMCGIKIGEMVTFIPTGLVVKVASDDSIEYEGRIYKLSPFVGTFMPEDHRNNSGAYQGAKYFSYNGKILDDLRKEREDA